jgi:transposase
VSSRQSGRKGLQTLIEVLNDERDQRMAEAARSCLTMLADQLRLVNTQIVEMDRRIMASARATDAGRRLMGIPGVGPLLASALIATIPDPHAFARGGTLPPGSAWYLNRTPAVARSGSVESPSKATDTCGRCSSSERWP